MNISENDGVPRKSWILAYSGGPLSFDFPKSSHKPTCYVTLFYCCYRVGYFCRLKKKPPVKEV